MGTGTSHHSKRVQPVPRVVEVPFPCSSASSPRLDAVSPSTSPSLRAESQSDSRPRSPLSNSLSAKIDSCFEASPTPAMPPRRSLTRLETPQLRPPPLSPPSASVPFRVDCFSAPFGAGDSQADREREEYDDEETFSESQEDEFELEYEYDFQCHVELEQDFRENGPTFEPYPSDSPPPPPSVAPSRPLAPLEETELGEHLSRMEKIVRRQDSENLPVSLRDVERSLALYQKLSQIVLDKTSFRNQPASPSPCPSQQRRVRISPSPTEIFNY